MIRQNVSLMKSGKRWIIFTLLLMIAFSAWAYRTVVQQCDIVGKASWYGKRWQGKPTASGELFDPEALTAAHRTLPLGTQLEVVDLEGNSRVQVTVNDRGPYIKGREIDLSRKAAQRLQMIEKGIKKVCIINLNKVRSGGIILRSFMIKILLIAAIVLPAAMFIKKFKKITQVR